MQETDETGPHVHIAIVWCVTEWSLRGSPVRPLARVHNLLAILVCGRGGAPRRPGPSPRPPRPLAAFLAWRIRWGEDVRRSSAPSPIAAPRSKNPARSRQPGRTMARHWCRKRRSARRDKGTSTPQPPTGLHGIDHSIAPDEPGRVHSSTGCANLEEPHYYGSI